MSNTYFAFRQFGIRQDRCAMKVSTDACIFGAWIPAPEQHDARILDIGAGTGLLSLMLAQRAPAATIDAVELDREAALQARENCADSIFAERVLVHQGDARRFTPAGTYDLIVSNPPFFTNSLKSPDAARNAARHTTGLKTDELFEIVSRLAKPGGRFALVMPAEARAAVERAAALAGFGCLRVLEIREREPDRSKRTCWLFRPAPFDGIVIPEILAVRTGTQYSAAFRQLLGSYYLLL